jgi:hypothetical protein
MRVDGEDVGFLPDDEILIIAHRDTLSPESHPSGIILRRTIAIS